jgi:diadenosine tetraphosphate (Ap4A) HIT family hydrolase
MPGDENAAPGRVDAVPVSTTIAAPTAIHTWVAKCRAGSAPGTLARLSSGWALLAERQVLPGYCLLLPDPVVPHLNALTPEDRAQFLGDMGRLGDALLAVTGAARINYAMFGNAEPALHAHLFPRQSGESEATRTAQPWALDWESAPRYSPQTHGGLQERLAAWLARHGVART